MNLRLARNGCDPRPGQRMPAPPGMRFGDASATIVVSWIWQDKARTTAVGAPTRRPAPPSVTP